LRLGPDAALCFAVSGLAFAVPSALLPFLSASNLGNLRISVLFTGVRSLWVGGMQPLAILVFLCGWLLPVLLLAALAALHGTRRMGPPGVRSPWIPGLARALEHWAIPEVQVLAVLVGIIKLGSVVQLTIGPGFWCYSAMALSLLLAQHNSDFAPAPGPIAAGAPEPAPSP
jgi:paraquat-inducible protein A